MPAGFRFPSDETELWYTYGWADEFRADVSFRRAHFVRAFARLGSGVTPEQADAELQAVVASLQEEYPATNSVMGADLRPLRDFLIGDVRTPLLVLLGAVTVLLLLACTNVANLMLVRASHRAREVAVRHALGAGRARVVRQMLTESLVLALVGGALGLGLGWLGVRWLAASTQVGIDGATALALDHRVVLFTLAVASLAGVLFGTAPAFRMVAGDVHRSLRDGGRGSSTGRSGLRTVGALVSVEVALALLLVAGAGLMVRTYWLLSRVDPGFRTEGVLAVQFAVQSARYPSRDQVLSFYDGFAEALEARPGIERVGTVGGLPLTDAGYTTQFQAEDWPPDRVGFEIIHRRADAGYFEALEHFTGEDPIGKKIAFDRRATAESTWWEIVGVVGDQRQASLAAPVRPEVYENRNQSWGRLNWFVVRGQGEAMSLLPSVRAVLEEMDPLIPLAEVRTLREVRTASMAREEFVLTLLGIFGVVALLLAAVGVYGVTAQAARRRTQEIGIRMALGAAAPDVLGMMLRQGAVVVGAGLVVGLATALLATRALESLLYGIEPTDPGTLASVVALLGAVALIACYVPARRATGVDPVRSLRTE